MTNPSIDYATEADLLEYYGVRPKYSVRALAVKIDDRVVAIAGLAIHEDRMTAFSDMRDELRPYKLTIMKTAKALMKLIDRHGVNVMAIASEDEPNSLAFLQRIGFKHCGERLCKI